MKVSAADSRPPSAPVVKTVTRAPLPLATSAALIRARSSEGLRNVVSRSCPFQRTIEPCTKPVPLTINVKPLPPASAVVGLSVVMRGSGLRLRTSSGKAFDKPPPGAGFDTCTCSVPTVARSLAVRAEVKCVALIYVVVVAMIFCHWAFLRLVRMLPATTTAISSLTVPVVGVFSGILLLGEKPGPADWGALVLILGALAVILLPSKGGRQQGGTLAGDC